ncbi:type VII secretion-associated serine protease mycosin [Kitasatospora sp. GP82]|uniref:type VII secretion-associated serine protease mycosin n=1 Tax=Kitasatospora sp. GP82 TaxID=3035089 RepID=UPI002475255F|nr:type VII secretion-associated serine protease mycosin [Kitasatospora sp. GP82]MDH6128581.1 type VII secretion-associated serine protease mycosin [Kitasatospora sp. GP82]
MSLGTYRRAAAGLVALGVIGTIASAPAYAADPSPNTADAAGVHWSPLGIAASAECASPAADVPNVPWALQRVLLDQLWNGGKITGAGVTVAVIDTGVDNTNPQLKGKVDDGGSLLIDQSTGKKVDGTGTDDTVGHGTKVAGIIAAGPYSKTGFVGLAPGARILSIRQNDSQGNGDVPSLIAAINIAIDKHVGVINISQDVRSTDEQGNFDRKADLQAVIKKAEEAKIVVVASSGNDGREGDTYPAAFDTVLSVGASDRNNERASFSQYGDFVKIAAPGVEMLSTVPKTGQCVDNGTSFSAPYVSGVAALLKQEYPDWTAAQIRTRIEQTAQRTERGPNRFVGWGVVDPVKAVRSETKPADQPHPDAQVRLDTTKIVAQPLGLEETQAQRDRRTGTYVLGVGALIVAGLAGGAIVVRDYRRRSEG